MVNTNQKCFFPDLDFVGIKIAFTFVQETLTSPEASIWRVRSTASPAFLTMLPEGLKLMSRSNKRGEEGEELALTMVEQLLLLSTQPLTWLSALQMQLIRGTEVDTTCLFIKHSKTGRLARRDIGMFYSRANRTFAFIVTKITGRKGKLCRQLRWRVATF